MLPPFILRQLQTAAQSGCYNPATMDLYPQVAEYVARHHLLPPDMRVVVAVSGGADSLCLLDCLSRLPLSLTVAHFDHGLRPESEAEAQKVAERAALYGLPFVVERGELAVQLERGGSVEATARTARYRFLFRVANDYQAAAVALGHTADDQVETVLMHFLRGAGPEGFAGMRPSADLGEWGAFKPTGGVRVVRPMLFARRSDTEAHCRFRGLEPTSDPTNQEVRFTRNRIRLELIPILETYNPGLHETLLRSADVMRSVADWIDGQVEAVWRDIVQRESPTAISLLASKLQQLPLALRRALLLRALQRLGEGKGSPGFRNVEQLREAADSGAPDRVSLSGGLEAFWMDDRLVVAAGDSFLPDRFPLLQELSSRALNIPGEVILHSGWRLSAQRFALESQPPETESTRANPWVAVMDLDQVPTEQVEVRPRRAGDRIQPLGMRGSQKLSDLFINEHVPRPLRERWPVVAAGEQILWVPGLRMADSVRLVEGTREVLRLKVSREPDGNEVNLDGMEAA